MHLALEKSCFYYGGKSSASIFIPAIHTVSISQRVPAKKKKKKTFEAFES